MKIKKFNIVLDGRVRALLAKDDSSRGGHFASQGLMWCLQTANYIFAFVMSPDRTKRSFISRFECHVSESIQDLLDPEMDTICQAVRGEAVVKTHARYHPHVGNYHRSFTAEVTFYAKGQRSSGNGLLTITVTFEDGGQLRSLLLEK